MAPLIALVGGFVLLRVLGLDVEALDGWQPALRGALALMFLVTAAAHFVNPLRTGLIAMIPPGLPGPALLVTITGVLEVAGVIGLLVPDTFRLAAGCLALLMLAMFPANVHAARRGAAGRPIDDVTAAADRAAGALRRLLRGRRAAVTPTPAGASSAPSGGSGHVLGGARVVALRRSLVGVALRRDPHVLQPDGGRGKPRPALRQHEQQRGRRHQGQNQDPGSGPENREELRDRHGVHSGRSARH